MKKFSIMATLLVGALMFTACEADRDDNPSIDLSRAQDPIHLNTPTFANATYDFDSSEEIELTCSAPNYGFPATVTYAVQLSLNEDMSKPNTLATTFSNNKMIVSAKELAVATTKQLMDKQKKKQEDFPMETPVYIRIHAYVQSAPGSETFSNVVKLNKVKTKFALPDVVVPEAFYVNGKFTENDWEKAVPTAPVHSNVNIHWRICWIDENGIQTSNAKHAPNYADDYITVTYKCSEEGFSVDNDGIIKATTPGWYIMLMDGKVNNEKRSMELTFSFKKAEIWLIGTSIVNPDAVSSDPSVVPNGIVKDDEPNGCWKENNLRQYFTNYVKFETPTTMNGEFVSPKLTSPVDGDGGTRAYVHIDGFDWWKTEFFVFSKKIVYRGNGGDQDRVKGSVGQRVYLKFSDDTGDVKL